MLTGGSNSFCSSSYSHISTAKRFRIKLIWCEPYLAVRNFSRRSLTASPFSLKFTRKFVRFGDRSQSLIDSNPHCILNRFLFSLFVINRVILVSILTVVKFLVSLDVKNVVFNQFKVQLSCRRISCTKNLA